MTMIHCQLWMGSVSLLLFNNDKRILTFIPFQLEPYMTESFIMNSFRKMGENPQTVKVMRNKFTGEPAGYCFVHFANDEEAIDAMHKLNGKPIPGTNPVVRFRLNNASSTGRTALEREFSVWVGDLSPDVDDYNLYRAFASKYNTIKTAKGKYIGTLAYYLFILHRRVISTHASYVIPCDKNYRLYHVFERCRWNFYFYACCKRFANLKWRTVDFVFCFSNPGQFWI